MNADWLVAERTHVLAAHADRRASLAAVNARGRGSGFSKVGHWRCRTGSAYRWLDAARADR